MDFHSPMILSSGVVTSMTASEVVAPTPPVEIAHETVTEESPTMPTTKTLKKGHPELVQTSTKPQIDNVCQRLKRVNTRSATALHKTQRQRINNQIFGRTVGLDKSPLRRNLNDLPDEAIQERNTFKRTTQ